MNLKIIKSSFLLPGLYLPVVSVAQQPEVDTSTWLSQPGIIGTVFLCVIVLLVFAFIIILRLGKLFNICVRARDREISKDAPAGNEFNADEGYVQVRQQENRLLAVHEQIAATIPLVYRQGLVQKVTLNPDFPRADEKKM